MAIERTRLKKTPKPGAPPWWEVQVKVTGHPRWITVGQTKRAGERRFLWQCEAQPWRYRPTVGREATRREAVTALLAHVHTGPHPHITSQLQGSTT